MYSPAPRRILIDASMYPCVSEPAMSASWCVRVGACHDDVASDDLVLTLLNPVQVPTSADSKFLMAFDLMGSAAVRMAVELLVDINGYLYIRLFVHRGED